MALDISRGVFRFIVEGSSNSTSVTDCELKACRGSTLTIAWRVCWQPGQGQAHAHVQTDSDETSCEVVRARGHISNQDAITDNADSTTDYHIQSSLLVRVAEPCDKEIGDGTKCIARNCQSLRLGSIPVS